MKFVTISREYGSGGRDIGLAVAKELGIELYDRDIIRSVAKESGLDYDRLSVEEETLTKADNFLRYITPMQYDQKDTLFDMERNAILSFVAQGPCVIVGRCGDAILQDAGLECFNVFLRADIVYRAINVGKRINSSDASEIRKTIKRVDAARRAHYERYSGRHWGDYKNYDLMLNTGAIGLDKCVKIIIEAVRASK